MYSVWSSPLPAAVCCWPSQVWGGYPAIAITIGFCGFIVLTMFVSTMPYRTSLFKNLYPTWDLMDSVEISSLGVTVCYEGSRFTCEWDWFSRAVVAGNVIALFPAIQPTKPVLIGESMLPRATSSQMKHDWGAIVDFVKTKTVAERKLSSNKRSKLDDAEKARGILELQCSQDRKRTVAAVPGSWLFCGSVTTADLRHIPVAKNSLKKTHRSHVVAWLLVVIVAVFCAGVSELAFGAFWILSGLYLLYVIAWRVKAGRRTLFKDVKKICYLQGYATTDHICLDGGISVSIFPWEDLQVLANHRACIAMQAGSSGQYVIVREDMFEMAEHWAEFQRLAESSSGAERSH